MTRILLVRITAISLATTFLAGCVGMKQSTGEMAMFYRDYTGATNGVPTALMRVSADGAIRITPNSACADFLNPQTGVALFSTYSMKSYDHLHNRKLGVVGEAPPGLTSTEISLEADKPVVISYTRNWTHRGTGYICQVHRGLTPDTDAQYHVVAEPIFAEGQCAVMVTRLSAPQGPVPTLPARLCGAP